MRRPDDSAPIPMSPPSQPKVKWDRAEARPLFGVPCPTDFRIAQERIPTEWHACQVPDLDLKIFPPEPLPERLFSAKISRALFGLV
jgi:hypothetical protein